MSYVTAQTVKYLAQVSHTQLDMEDEIEFDSFITDHLIPQCERFIDNWVCRQGGRDGTVRYFNLTTDTFTLDGNGKSVLFVPPRFAPLRSVGTLTIDGGAITASDIAVGNYGQYIEYDGGIFTSGEMNISVTGSYGYANVPADISYIAGQLCANVLLDMVRRRIAPQYFISWLQGRGQSIEIRTLFAQPVMLNFDFKRLLNNYRIKWVELG
jgi:hypothetical protein